MALVVTLYLGTWTQSSQVYIPTFLEPAVFEASYKLTNST